jgi:hypothetical protein
MTAFEIFCLALSIGLSVRGLTDIWFWDNSLLYPLRQRTMAWTGKIGTLFNCRFCFSVQASFWLTLCCVVPYLLLEGLSWRSVFLCPLVFLSSVHIVRLLADLSYPENDAALMNEGRVVQSVFYASSGSDQTDILFENQNKTGLDRSNTTRVSPPDVIPFPVQSVSLKDEPERDDSKTSRWFDRETPDGDKRPTG